MVFLSENGMQVNKLINICNLKVILHKILNKGFNISLYMNLEDGFIYGGNDKNCLTWMDKMGSSAKAGNIGQPATPRDGAPIEMTCLLKKCLEILINLNNKKIYPYNSVNIGE